MTRPRVPPQRYRMSVASNLQSGAQVTAPIEFADIVAYCDDLRRMWRQLDALERRTLRYKREAARLFYRVRALHEFIVILEQHPAANRSEFSSLAQQAREFYLNVIADGNVMRPTQTTHPTHHRRVQRVAQQALRLLTHNRTNAAGGSVGASLDALRRNPSHAVQDLHDNYLLVNWHALAGKLGKTQASPDLAREANTSIQRATHSEAPRSSRIADWLVALSSAVGASVGSGPVGNSAMVYLMEIGFSGSRYNGVQAAKQLLLRGLSWAMPAGQRSQFRRLLQQPSPLPARQLATVHFQAGPVATLLPVVIDYFSVMSAFDRLIRTEGNDWRAWFDATQGIATGSADTMMLVHRLSGGPVTVPVRTALGRLAGLSAVEQGSSAEALALSSARVMTTVGSIGRVLGPVFAAGTALFEINDGLGRLANHDYTGATFSGFRALGSGLIAMGLILSGPLVAPVGLAGIVISTASTIAEVAAGPRAPEYVPARIYLNDLIRLINEVESSGEPAQTARSGRMDAGVGRNPSTIDVIGGSIPGYLESLQRQINNIRHWHTLSVPNQSQLSALQHRCRYGLGLDPSSFPPGLLTVRPVHGGHASRMSP